MDRPRILLVCTGNQCRSPMAEGLLRDLLAQRGADAEVVSAGLLPGGSPASPAAVEVLGTRGIDIGGHVSRALTAGEMAAADLIVTMERRHLQEAVLLDASARPRTFTLVDLARRIDAGGRRGASESMRAWAARMSASRTLNEVLGVGDDNVSDPIGEPVARYAATADLLADLLGRVVAGAFPASVVGAA